MNISSALDLAASQPLPLLILDFDGTVCLGDGPVLAYADAVAHFLPDTATPAFRDGLDAFLAHDPAAAQFKDGYAAVAALAEGLVDAQALNRAYAQSRQRLAAGQVEISTPPGLADFLAGLAGRAHRMVLTNAPLEGVGESLAALGLAGTIDGIVPDAGKPAGFIHLLPKLLAGRPPRELMSVGDVWVNDIEPPARHGCATAFIDRFNHRTGDAALREPRFELLYPGITEWAADPAAFTITHPGTSPSLPEKAQL
ncbi:HAD family hydrolase [Arthrobacter sp. ERGS1:01]|uniref:HAD family hydrolase n=1 Tax=Arthrobacter sp. ERGS1:01 TaxID=1704044 RepID=UPI0006B6347C|nr:HAD family hydrolase [Arthrobacter sp. ERGS1:01]